MRGASCVVWCLPANGARDRPGRVEAMRQAVAGLRRARALGVSAAEQGDRRVAATGRGKLMRAAAAAALVIGLGSQLPLGRRGVDAAVSAPLVAETVPAGGQGGAGGGGTLGVSGDVGRPSARVYQISYRDMAVVMVVDKSLDL